jgi:eukaryotic-like serine/threonine-protein kinase
VGTLGRFEILQELSLGGMGVVFRAHNPEMARDVPLKVLRLDPGLEPVQMDEIRRFFEREAHAAGP